MNEILSALKMPICRRVLIAVRLVRLTSHAAEIIPLPELVNCQLADG